MSAAANWGVAALPNPWLHYQTPHGQVAEPVRGGDLAGTHARLAHLIDVCDLEPGVWFIESGPR